MTLRGVTLRAVLWDYGGVLADSPFDAFATYERERDLPDGFLRRVNATDPDTNAWARYERGDLDLDGFAATFEVEADAAGAAGRVDGREVIAMLAFPRPRPAMLAAVDRCRDAGLRTALVTNNVAVGDHRVHDEEFLTEHFDAVVESSRDGVRKPDPAFYTLALDRLGVAADEAVFLDDLGVNLKPARALGMTTIKVLDPGQALTELGELLGLALR